MKLSRVIVLVTFFGILAMSSHVSIDSDTWWHLRSGQWIVENQQLIREDIFSYTSAGNSWQYPGQWVQVLMFKLYNWFGPGGLNLWVSITVVTIFAFIWRTTQGNSLFRAIVLIFAAISSAIYWAARPYLISYLLFAIYFYLLEKNSRIGKRNLWLIPILMIAWVNSHGGFLAGFILWVPYFAQSFLEWIKAKRLNQAEEIPIYKGRLTNDLKVGLGMLLATLLNPQGLSLWTLPFTTVSRQAEQLFIAEWQSPDFHDPTLLPFALMLVLTIVILGGSKKRIKLYEILLLGGFGLLGLISVRNIFFFVIVAPAILSRAGESFFTTLATDFRFNLELDFSKQPNRIGSLINFAMVVLVGLVALLRLVSYLPRNVNQEELEKKYPVAAVEFIKSQNLEGRMFNTYNYGGYLIWALPEFPVFVDGRADLHKDDIILTWYQVINGSEEYRELFKEYNIRFVVVEPGVPLLFELESNNWTTIYEDDLAVVAVSPEN